MNPTLGENYLSGPTFEERHPWPARVEYGAFAVAVSLIAVKLFTKMTWTKFAIGETAALGTSFYAFTQSGKGKTVRDTMHEAIRELDRFEVKYFERAFANNELFTYLRGALPAPESSEKKVWRNFLAAAACLEGCRDREGKESRLLRCYVAYFHHLFQDPTARMTPEQMEAKMKGYADGNQELGTLADVKHYIWHSSPLSRSMWNDQRVIDFANNLVPEGVTPERIVLTVVRKSDGGRNLAEISKLEGASFDILSELRKLLGRVVEGNGAVEMYGIGHGRSEDGSFTGFLRRDKNGQIEGENSLGEEEFEEACKEHPAVWESQWK